MRNHLLIVIAILLLAAACKQKDKEEPKKFVSVLSLIEQQAKHIDTSLYSIRKIVIKDSLHSDTTFIKREDFREVAKEFLSIPDLSDPKVAKRFKEETRYDSLIRRVVITYLPLDPKTEELKKQELLVSTTISSDGTNKVTGIIIDRVINDRNGSLSQNMLWRTDKSFLITTMAQKPNEPEIITVTKVIWNEDEYQ